jgi:hypothetical protein
MKIKKISIRGFRGFNAPRQMDFDERLTLIYAPNSYGKTSISESFEWLIYGSTSRVESAESKDEYKGSLRNVHLSPTEHPRVALEFVDGTDSRECAAELVGEECKKTWEGNPVSEWPFSKDLRSTPPPFILQHALKNLLLAAPIKRFDDFAKLLGLEALGKIHRDLIAFCTKPPVPRPILGVLAELESILTRADSSQSMKEIAKTLRKGIDSVDKSFQLVWIKARSLVPTGTAQDAILAKLLNIRDEAVAKFYKGKIELPEFTGNEQTQNQHDEDFLTTTVAKDFIEKYLALSRLKSVQKISEAARLHELGVALLEADSSRCPLCKQAIDGEIVRHIREEHTKFGEERNRFEKLEAHKVSTATTLRSLRERLDAYHTRIRAKTHTLLQLEIESPMESLVKILLPKHQLHYDAVVNAVAQLGEADRQFALAIEDSKQKIKIAAESVESNLEEEASISQLAASLIFTIGRAAEYKATIEAHASPVTDAARVLKHELDALAGTQDVSVIIDLISNHKRIKKKMEIDRALESLKDLKQRVDKFVTDKMLEVISGEFGSEVANWYEKIKTTGDPDVHFCGFDMKKTSQGGRVQIRARSYARDLVSAVSSLSESKLNALGLCLSIAINVQSASPFDFLVIDDPIQSWDQEHETRFIEVIRELVNRGKQVVLLSHSDRWLKQVRSACSDLNGRYYEITGYTQTGPEISEFHWAETAQRLDTIIGILNDQLANTTRLQQAEEEIRIVLHQLTVDLHFKKSGKRRSAHSLNAEETRKLLLSCGVDPPFVNKIKSAFETVDPAHHAQADYSPTRERIKAYYAWSKELERIVKQA